MEEMIAKPLFSEGESEQKLLHCSVSLESLATAVPENRLPRELLEARAKAFLGDRYDDFMRLSSLMQNAGVESRYLAMPPEWYLQDHDFRERNRVYLETGTALLETAARKAMENAGLQPGDIDYLVCVSSTGIATPSIDARMMQNVGFRPDIRRVPVFGLGCAGGVTGMAIATRLARAHPDSTVLLVVCELCSLSFSTDNTSKADYVATALFGDGAAAACLRSRSDGSQDGIILGEGFEHLWRDTLGHMGWDIGPDGFALVLDRDIPKFVKKELSGAVKSALAAARIDPAEIDRFICHPGSPKVLAAMENALGLRSKTLDHEGQVLREYGNMSAPTVLFILEKVLAEKKRGRYLLAGMGPGFTASFLPFIVHG